MARYMAAFMEIKRAIDDNPKCKTTEIARQFKIGQQPITMLKHHGVIEQKNGLKKWVGQEPNVTMVIQIAEAVHNYHAELNSRKKSGELFKKSNKASQAPKSVTPSQTDLNEWKSAYNSQKAVKTDIPIRSEIYDQSTAAPIIEHHGIIESTKPETRKFEVRIFGIKLFTINY